VTTRDVVVEADKAKEEAKYNSQSVTVITKEDIARKQGKSVEDVIFNEVGVTRTVDAMGKVGISIRGADPRHTLIMVDGQPVLGDVSKYSGNGDELMRIGAENIERIEIIRGAASAKYGSDAIGGVVNVITKGPKDAPSVQLNAEASYHTSRYTSSNETSAMPSNFYLRADSGQIGKFNMSAWGSKRSVLSVYANGRSYNTNNGWGEEFKPSLRYYGDEKNVGINGNYAFNEKHKIFFTINHDREDVERKNKNADPNNSLAVTMEPLIGYKYNGSVVKTEI
ncbi:TonB-dependent receptor plug domain-containing protein, partial [Megasphaera cerevisiae]|uniref:TonB-dependent receptor plug domain-containing protein n=1 Tax=Megasphaera cerevisiae TaxID=39029 RepID=UPI000A6CF4D2